MKIRTISRSADDYVPLAKESIRLPRNLNPDMHPFERAREYTRALNATKLDRMFSKPFLYHLGHGHVDGIYAMAKDIRTLGAVATGSGDGVVKAWNLGSQDEEYSIQAHRGIVKGLCFTIDHKLLSCSSDGTVKLWDQTCVANQEPLQTYHSECGGGLASLDHHRSEPQFITAGTKLEVWDINRTIPLATSMSWGADNLNSVKYSMVETNLCASTGNDRSIVLYDLRTHSPVQKVLTALSNNSLSWSPLEAFTFAAANEDHNTYLYDMRNLRKSLNVFKDHVAAVMDVDFSPTGQELVTGSYDRTVRIYAVTAAHSRDVYHTKRMQRVFCVRYSMDSKYIITGSDDGSPRVWRSQANERVGVKSGKQKAKLNYDRALVERYKHLPEIRRIHRHRHLPKAIKLAHDTKRAELEAIKRRKDRAARSNKIKNTKPVTRDEHIVGVAITDNYGEK